jgi:hypothetical protein
VTGPVTGLSVTPPVGDLQGKSGHVQVRPDRTTEYTFTAQAAGNKPQTQKATVQVRR